MGDNQVFEATYLKYYPVLLVYGKDPKLFKEDMLHLNADGYALWTKAIQELLKSL